VCAGILSSYIIPPINVSTSAHLLVLLLIIVIKLIDLINYHSICDIILCTLMILSYFNKSASTIVILLFGVVTALYLTYLGTRNYTLTLSDAVDFGESFDR